MVHMYLSWNYIWTNRSCNFLSSHTHKTNKKTSGKHVINREKRGTLLKLLCPKLFVPFPRRRIRIPVPISIWLSAIGLSPHQWIPEVLRFLEILENNCVYEDDNEKRLMPLRSLNSGWWIVLQIMWRFLFSSGVALLVFYIATQPTRPDISIRVICILY